MALTKQEWVHKEVTNQLGYASEAHLSHEITFRLAASNSRADSDEITRLVSHFCKKVAFLKEIEVEKQVPGKSK